MLEQLATKPLTRKQFLVLIASFVIGIMGIERILKLGSSNNSSTSSRKPTGFGGGVYGGK